MRPNDFGGRLIDCDWTMNNRLKLSGPSEANWKDKKNQIKDYALKRRNFVRKLPMRGLNSEVL
jgi:hypothetical protein